jgi:hypothetical protein
MQQARAAQWTPEQRRALLFMLERRGGHAPALPTAITSAAS